MKMAEMRQHYTLICGFEVSPGVKCERVIYLTRHCKTHQRPVRYGLCMLHRSCGRWNYREAPLP